MQKWYVVQAISGHENKVKARMEENKISRGMTDLVSEILVPVENVYEVKAGEQKIVEKKLWPGYILVKMTLTDESWHFINDINGVIGFLGGEKPTSLTDNEVQEILSELADKKKEVSQKHKVDVGDNVKITNGVFENFQGTVLEVNHEKGRLSVLVTIFGRDTRVDDLEFWQVEQVQSDKES